MICDQWVTHWLTQIGRRQHSAWLHVTGTQGNCRSYQPAPRALNANIVIWGKYAFKMLEKSFGFSRSDIRASCPLWMGARIATRPRLPILRMLKPIISMKWRQPDQEKRGLANYNPDEQVQSISVRISAISWSRPILHQSHRTNTTWWYDVCNIQLPTLVMHNTKLAVEHHDIARLILMCWLTLPYSY